MQNFSSLASKLREEFEVTDGQMRAIYAWCSQRVLYFSTKYTSTQLLTWKWHFIVKGELWTERIMLYYVPNIPGAWLDSNNIKSVVIDENPGQPFEASILDVNADGKNSLL